MKSDFFANCKSIEELKKEYKRLCKIFHPDNNPDNNNLNETMAEINAEYDIAFDSLKRAHNAKSGNENNQNTEHPEEFREIINALMKLDRLDLEVCGNWLWIGGDSYKHRQTLKDMRFKYAPKKKLWYLGEMKRKKKGSTPMENIRSKYGSEVYVSQRNLQLA